MAAQVRISESPTKSGWSIIVTEPECAQDLTRMLRSLHLATTPLRDSASGAKADARGAGAKQVAQVFEIQATPKSLEPLVARWLQTRH